MLSADWIWFLTLSCAPSRCGGRSGSVRLSHSWQRRPVGHIRCAQTLDDWLVDWKEEDRSLEDRLSVPDGSLRKNRRQSRNLCPRKTTGCQLHASSNVEKRQSGSEKNQEVILLECMVFALFSSHLYQFAGASREHLGSHTIPRMSIRHLPFSLWLK